MSNLQREAAESLLALRNPHTSYHHSAQRATQRAAQSTLLAQEAARRARATREAVHRHNAAAKLQAATRGKTVRRRSWRPKGMKMTGFTVGVAPPSSQTRRKKKRNKSIKYKPYQAPIRTAPPPMPDFLLGPQPYQNKRHQLFPPPAEPYRPRHTNYVSTGSTKRRRTMGGKHKPRKKKSKGKKRKN